MSETMTKERLDHIRREAAISFEPDRLDAVYMRELINHIDDLTAQLSKAREDEREACAKICDGELLHEGHYVFWPCWNPNGNLGVERSEATLAKALAQAIRSRSHQTQSETSNG